MLNKTIPIPSSVDRPLDCLNNLKGKEVCVTIKGGDEFVGKLIAFDIHINLVVEVNKINRFIRGDIVQWIDETAHDSKLSKKEIKK